MASDDFCCLPLRQVPPLICQFPRITRLIQQISSRKDKPTLTVEKKLLLTKFEAAAYSNIGINKLEDMLRSPNCSFALYIDTKKLVKRKEFEESISQKTVIWRKFIIEIWEPL